MVGAGYTRATRISLKANFKRGLSEMKSSAVTRKVPTAMA